MLILKQTHPPPPPGPADYLEGYCCKVCGRHWVEGWWHRLVRGHEPIRGGIERRRA